MLHKTSNRWWWGGPSQRVAEGRDDLADMILASLFDHGRWTMDRGRLTMNDERWTIDHGRWTVDYGPLIMSDGPLTMDHDYEPWTL